MINSTLEKKDKNKNYLTKVDKLENHINKLTLKFHNEEFEHEWRLHEITQRHSFLYLCSGYFVYHDVLYGMILSNTTWQSKIYKGVITILCILVIYQIVFHAKAKEMREIDIKRQSKQIDFHKWNQTNLQKKIKEESFR